MNKIEKNKKIKVLIEESIDEIEDVNITSFFRCINCRSPIKINGLRFYLIFLFFF